MKRKIRNFLKGKVVIISIALVTFVIGGLGGFFIGQNHQISQQEEIMQRLSNHSGRFENGQNGYGEYGNSNSQMGGSGSDANSGASTGGNTDGNGTNSSSNTSGNSGVSFSTGTTGL